MAKYLRSISVSFTDANGVADPSLYAAISAVPDTFHLAWMYEHFATPLLTGGVGKINVFFTAADVNRAPGGDGIEVFGIADVYERFDVNHFASLTPKHQQRYYVDRLQAAMLKCANHFGWSSEALIRTYERIVADDFVFRFDWGKPLTSPDRKSKVQAQIDAGHPARIYLVVFDRAMNEVGRMLLTEYISPGGVDFVLGKISWIDASTIKAQHKNARDYWLCGVNGSVTFHYPRAETGDPHGEFDLGKMYYEGTYVLKDEERGIGLIRSAAAKGFKHAINFLSALPSSSQVEPAILARGPMGNMLKPSR